MLLEGGGGTLLELGASVYTGPRILLGSCEPVMSDFPIEGSAPGADELAASAILDRTSERAPHEAVATLIGGGMENYKSRKTPAKSFWPAQL